MPYSGQGCLQWYWHSHWHC